MELTTQLLSRDAYPRPWYEPEVRIVPGPRALGDTGDGSYPTLYGYAWVAVLQREPAQTGDYLRIYQITDAIGSAYRITTPYYDHTRYVWLRLELGLTINATGPLQISGQYKDTLPVAMRAMGSIVATGWLRLPLFPVARLLGSDGDVGLLRTSLSPDLRSVGNLVSIAYGPLTLAVPINLRAGGFSALPITATLREQLQMVLYLEGRVRTGNEEDIYSSVGTTISVGVVPYEPNVAVATAQALHEDNVGIETAQDAYQTNVGVAISQNPYGQNVGASILAQEYQANVSAETSTQTYQANVTIESGG